MEKQTAEQRSGRKTITRLTAEQKHALDKLAFNLSARLGIRFHRTNITQGVIAAMLGIPPADPKSELAMNEIKRGIR